MIQLKLFMLGVTLIATIGYAVYSHYQNEQPQSYGPPVGRRRSPQSRTTRSIQNSRSEFNCSICLSNEYVSTGGIKYLSCGHVFHSNCVEFWFSSGSNTCPNCRAKVR